MLKIKMLLARKPLLLIPFGLALVLVLSGCGYDTGAPTIPPSTPNQIVTKETDFGAGNFIRDGLISLLESFAHLMGFVGVGVLKWFINTIEGFNLTREGSYRQCQTTFDAANPVDPLSSCAIQVYDAFKFLPLAVLSVTLLYFLLKYTFQGIFRSGQLSITDFLNNVLITTVIAFNLDYLVTMVVDISSKLFLLILSSSGASPMDVGAGIFGQLKDMGIAIAAVGFCLMALLAGVLLTFGGLNTRWKSQGFDILKYGLIGLMGIATLSLTIPALVDLLSLASGSNPPVGGSTPIQSMDAQLNNLQKLFDLNESLHHKDVGALLLMVILTVPAMLSFLVIGVFFFIRVLLFLLFFLMGVPAVAARLTAETAFFFDVWWKGLLKLAATSLPIAVILRIAIEVSNSISVSGNNLIGYIVLMIIITLLFVMGGMYAIWIMKSETRSAVRNVGALKQGVVQLKERYIAGGATSAASPSKGETKTPNGKSSAAFGEKPQTEKSSSDRFRSNNTPALPLTAQVMTQAISTGMTQAFQRQQATTERQVGGALSQLSQIKVGLDEIKSGQRQQGQTNPNQEMESLLQQLLEATRRRQTETKRQTEITSHPTPFPAGGGARQFSSFEEGQGRETNYASPSRSPRRRNSAKPLATPLFVPPEEGNTMPLPASGRYAGGNGETYNARGQGRRIAPSPLVTPLVSSSGPGPTPSSQGGSSPSLTPSQTPSSDGASLTPSRAQGAARRTDTRRTATRPGPVDTATRRDPVTPSQTATPESASTPTGSVGAALPPPAAPPARPVYLPAERAWRRPDGGGSISTRPTGPDRSWNANAAMIINPNTGMPYSGQGKRLKQQKAV